MDNTAIAQALRDIAQLLEISGDNPFKIRSYNNAAQTIEKLGEPASQLLMENRLRDIEGIGEALEKKIAELVETGGLAYLDNLRAKFPDTILDLLRVDGLGPKSVKRIYETLGVASIEALREACAQGRLSAVSGFTRKREIRILDAIAFIEQQQNLFRLNVAWVAAAAMREYLRAHSPASQVKVAGSLRRFKEVVKDVDILAASDDPLAVMRCFLEAPEVARVVSSGNTKSAVVLKDGLPVDLRVVAPSQFPYALLHFTGSKEHNVLLRRRAAERNMKLNEYGLFREDGTVVECADEREIYKALGLPLLPPEVREGVFELELTPPIRLVTAKDLRGMVHCHTRWSDGLDSIQEMAAASEQAGYEYLVVTDHSKSSVYVNGLTPERVAQQHAEIDALNEAADTGFRILKGIESDVLSDGALDYPSEVLRSFDFVIASIHANFDMDEDEATNRILRAMENPYTSAVGHLTGRLLLTRPGYPVNVDKIVDAAVANGVAIEINANPRRLDMDWRYLRRAAEKGAHFVIGPDAHRAVGLHNIRYGVGIARKGALAPEHILNCRSLKEFLRWRKS